MRKRLYQVLEKELKSSFWAGTARGIIVEDSAKALSIVQLWAEQRPRVQAVNTNGLPGGDRYCYVSQLLRTYRPSDPVLVMQDAKDRLDKDHVWIIAAVGPLYAIPTEPLLDLCDRGPQSSKLLLVSTLPEYQRFLREAKPSLKNKLIKPYNLEEA